MQTALTQSHLSAPAETASRWERLTLASGAVAAALYLAGAALFILTVAPHLPPINAAAAERAAFYAQQSHSLIYRLVSYLGEAQMAFLILFFGGLFGLVRRIERGAEGLAAALLVAGSALAVISPLAIMLEDHLLLGLSAAGAEPLVANAFDGIGPLSFALSGFAQAIVLGGTAAVLLPHRLVARWIAWFGVAVAVLSLLGTGMLVAASLFPLAALATLLFRVWLLALSLNLIHRASSSTTSQKFSSDS